MVSAMMMEDLKHAQVVRHTPVEDLPSVGNAKDARCHNFKVSAVVHSQKLNLRAFSYALRFHDATLRTHQRRNWF